MKLFEKIKRMNKNTRFFLHPKPGPAFYRLFASFFAMLVLLLAALLFNYFYARTLLQEENLDYQKDVLTTVQMTMDEKVRNLQTFALDISNDQTLARFLASDDLDEDELHYRVWELTNYLKTYSATFSNICELYIYSAHYDYLLGTQASDPRASEGIIRLGTEELNRQLYTVLTTPRQYCKFTVLNDGEKRELVMALSSPLWSINKDVNGTVCLLVHEERVLRTIREISELQGGLVCLLDKEGQVLMSSGNKTLLPLVEKAWGSGTDSLNFENKVFTALTVDSQFNGWQYLSLQPEHASLPRLRAIENISLYIFAAVLFFGGIAAYVLSRRNYQPLENLIESLRKQSALISNQANSDASEFAMIEQSFHAVSKSVSAYADMLSAELPRLQEGVLMQLLYGAVIDYDAFSEMLSDVGFLLPYKWFSVAIIRGAELEGPTAGQQAILSVLVNRQIANSIPPEIPYALVGFKSDAKALILNGDQDSFEEDAATALQTVSDMLRSEFSQMIAVNLSEAVDSLSKVSHAFYTAAHAPFLPQGGVQRLSSLSPAQTELSAYEIVAPLKNCIEVGEIEKARALLRNKYKEEIVGRSIALHTLRGYYVAVVNIICSAVSYTERSTESDVMAQLFVMRNPEDMEALVEAEVNRLCESVNNSRQSHAVQLTEQILSFVKEQFANPDLSLTFVAEHFYITPSYLSAFFRENTGDTFLNYLTHLRINKAKQLIRQTNLPMGQIATSVGYASGNTFTRIFKKVEGITPTSYRESVQK